MKRKIVLVSIMVCIMVSVQAQKFTFSVKGGYAFGVDKNKGISDNSFADLVNENYTAGNYSENPVKFSLGAGVPVELSVGYEIHKNISVNMGVYYHLGNTYYAEFKSDQQYSDYTKTTIGSNYIGFTPSITLHTPLSEKLTMYSDIGIVFAQPKIIFKGFSEYGEYDPTIRHTSQENYKIYGGNAIGGKFTIGASYKINKLLSVNLDVSHLSMVYTPAKATMIENTIDGNDVLNYKSVLQREYVFIDEISDLDNKDDDQPRKVFKCNYSYSNVAINMGIIFLF